MAESEIQKLREVYGDIKAFFDRNGMSAEDAKTEIQGWLTRSCEIGFDVGVRAGISSYSELISEVGAAVEESKNKILTEMGTGT